MGAGAVVAGAVDNLLRRAIRRIQAMRTFYPTRPRRFFLLQWHITERCNNRCAHCYQETFSSPELDFDALLSIVEQFKAFLNALNECRQPTRGHVSVTGGEPFLRKDFLDLLEVLAENRTRFSFAILTNGSFINASMARRLGRLGPFFVQVSIEGSQATHDRIRGPGDFARTVSAIELLTREQVRTFISFTAHQGNYREFREVARLAHKLRVSRLWADRLIPCGSGASMTMQILDPIGTQEFFSIMRREQRRVDWRWFSRTEIAMHRALQFLVAGGHPYTCKAGDSLLTVQPNGDLYPCRRMPIRAGNLMETPLTELYFNSALFRSLRDRGRVSEGCNDCSYFPLCRGGLKCLSYAMTGDPFKADPGCWLPVSNGKCKDVGPTSIFQCEELSPSLVKRGEGNFKVPVNSTMNQYKEY